MAENRVYFYIKLKEDFFLSKEMKIIRKRPSGADAIIILLKMQLYALKTGGLIEIDGLCDNPAEEIALMIDEDPAMIKLAITYFQDPRFTMIGIVDERDIKMLLHDSLVGSETASTIRSRKSRMNTKALQCNTIMTQCNGYTTQCINDATPMQQNATTCIAIVKDIVKDNSIVNSKDINKKTIYKKESLKEKKIFSEFVMLTDDEHAKLVEQYGDSGTKEIIAILNDYKEAHGKKYKSDAAAIRTWVIAKYEEKKSKTMGKGKRWDDGKIEYRSLSTDELFGEKP